MTKLRPECNRVCTSAMPDDTALFLIMKSVGKRRRLIHGKLRDADGRTCAIGAFWDDHPGIALNSDLIDEVAAVNDSIPPTASLHQRWKEVNSWLRFKIKALTAKKSA